MSKLFLVRHGQASFPGPDYDKLTPTGENQARLLGNYWAGQQMVFDQVCAGPSARHRETARLVGVAYQRAGLPWPEPAVMEELDEYQAEAVLRQGLPQVLGRDDHVRRLHQAYESSTNRSEQLKNFQRMYSVIVRLWVEGQLTVPDIEPWPEFCARVERGVSRILGAGGKGRLVAAFTSGGPIGVTMQRALKTSPGITLELVWMVRNGSFSEFWFSDNRFTVSTFNAFPHLDDPSLLTYR